jgi:hypothetical protein
MKKVYCKNCKYYLLYFRGPACTHFAEFINDILAQKITDYKDFLINHSIRSGFGVCRSYKCKWWKFWARLREIEDYEDCHDV